jgi:hypothetical protein
MSVVRAIPAALLMVAVWASALCAEDHGKLRVHVEDFTGHSLPAYITITEIGTQKVVATTQSKEDKDATVRVPYGRYLLTIELPGFNRYERRIKVLGKAAYVRASLRVVTPDETRIVGRYVYPFLRGSLQGNLSKHADLWAKLVPVGDPEDSLMDAKIDKDGHFQFDGLLDNYGNYEVLILDGRNVIATQQVDVVAHKDVTITLQ